MKSERRRYIRFALPANAYGALGPSLSKVGKIKNICKGGLALEYITDEAINLEIFQVEIFLHGEDLHLSQVPCQLVYDIDLNVSKVNRSTPKSLMRRQCGVRFGKLSKDFRIQLEHLIRDHLQE